ncbi:unnamed protein product, partial [Symbiodinium microadriaticum]
MPRKVFPDGAPCSDEECQGMAAIWDTHAELRERARSGKRLMQSANGDAVVLPNLENIKHNFLVLKEVVLKMSARQRLSADPAEMLAKMFLGWYDKHKAHFKEVQNFDAAVWSFKDGWTVHKMFTHLRAEAEDNDDDDEASSKAMEGEASSVAMEGEASSKAMEGEASSEAMEGEASSEAMQEEASWALRRQTLTREEKLQIDSEAAGYRLAHTISESWSDEHMPKTPPQLQEAVSAEPGLLTQKTLLDETPNDRSPDVCTVDSSPDEASSSTRPVLSRRPHVPSKTWNADLSPALTNEQKARFLEACRAKIRTMGAERFCLDFMLLCRQLQHLPAKVVAMNPDQEDTYVPEAEQSLEGLIEEMAPSPPPKNHMELDVLVNPSAASKVSEEDEPVSPCEEPASKDEQMRLILESRKAKKAKAAQKAIAADADTHAEAPAGAKRGRKPKNTEAKATSSKTAPNSSDQEALPAAAAKPGPKAKAQASHPEPMPGTGTAEPASESKAPKQKPGPKPKRAKADDPQEPESNPGAKPKRAKPDDPQEPESKPGAKPKGAKPDDPQESLSKRGAKPKRAKPDDPQEPESKPGAKPKRAKPDDPQESVSKPADDPQEPTGAKPERANTDDPQEPVLASDSKPQGKPKPKGKAAMKRPAAKVPVPGPAPNDEAEQAENDIPLECELPKTFARRAMPTTATGINKYRRIVGAFRAHVLPKLKDGQKCVAEDRLGS